MTRRPGVRWKAVSLKGARRLTAGLVPHRLPAWSPDGRWLAFAIGEGRAAMWVVTDRRGRVARVLEGPADGGCSFAPDGALAYTRVSGAFSEVWLAPASGAPPVRLLGGDGHIYREPAFSPDGRTLAFAGAERSEEPTRLFLLEVASGAQRALPVTPGRQDSRPAFSPDGSELFFEGASEGEVSIWALKLEGEVPIRVTVSGAVSRRPAPLSRDLVIVERSLESERGVRTVLVLVDRIAVRERELEPAPPSPSRAKPAPPRPRQSQVIERREPSVQRGKGGKIKLAFAALVESGGEPRYEIVTARLRGVTVAPARKPEEAAEETKDRAPEEPPETESSAA